MNKSRELTEDEKKDIEKELENFFIKKSFTSCTHQTII